MRKTSFPIIFLLTILLTFWITPSALAQDSQGLVLSLSRDFGFSSGSGQIQGTFSLKIKDPKDVVRVVFMLDDQPINEDVEAPFQYQFNTGSYSLAEHKLSAVGYTAGGQQLSSNEIRVVFVSAEESGKFTLKIIVPLFAVIFGLMALSYIVPMILNRGKNKVVPLGQPRNYGLLGGTICPKCSRPFSLNLFAINLLVGRMDRCPHCGRWGLVRRYPLEMLRTAETAELAMAGENEEEKPLSKKDQMEKALEDSRYQDL